jgi:YfiR/HmsC-like
VFTECWASLLRTTLFQSVTVCAAIAILSLTPRIAAAQDVTESALKAAFIFNFAKFTEWPAEVMTIGEPLVLCVLGDAAIGEALERAVRSRTVLGHRMDVSQATSNGSPREGCHILYVSGLTTSQAAKLLTGLRDAPVLTISDAEGFTQMGGIAQFFFEHGQLRFNVHVESAKRARLRISSRLLALATAK